MSADKPAGAIPSVAVVLAACCGLHAVLLLVGGITVAGLDLGSWTLAFGGSIVLAVVVVVVRFRHHRCPRPVPAPDGTEGHGDARRSRAG